VVLIAMGGECIEDVQRLRSDGGLVRLLGFKPSCRTQLKAFLYAFHQAADGRRLTPQEDAVLSVAGRAQLRAEGPGLRGLADLVGNVFERLQQVRGRERATLDVDATIIESSKRQALRTYEGMRGYQPQMALWAEQGVWVLDEFRDGNVNAEFEARAFLQRAFGRLPLTVTERRLRADSALYNEAALTWADDHSVAFVVSADMSDGLRKRVAAVAEAGWQPYRSSRVTEAAETEERQWAEVIDFIPDWARNQRRQGLPFRYIAIRVRSRQRDLLESDEAAWRSFAVVTNMDWEGDRLLRWHREKQGTVEHGHAVMKNELAGGTLPSGRFGANAAWWRLNVLVHNLLQLLKIQALPQDMHAMQPKALRFRLLAIAGLLIETGRSLIVRLAASTGEVATVVAARLALAARRPDPLPPSTS
jgi:hypothetical protein